MGGNLTFKLLLCFIFVYLEKDGVSEELWGWIELKFISEQFGSLFILLFVFFLLVLIPINNLENHLFLFIFS